jgi:hypothetical protein
MFLEDSTTRVKNARKIEEKRETAFLGSRMHFFRTLWENDLDSSGYYVLDARNRKLCYNDLVIQTDSLSKFIKNLGTLTISHNQGTPETYITFTQDSVCFYKNGSFNGSGIKWDGNMAVRRIADQLPYEYSYKKNNR